VKRDVATAIRLLAIPAVALLLVVLVVPGRTSIAVRICALIACAIALGLVLAALRRAYPAAPHLRGTMRARAPVDRPAALVRIENEVILGIASEVDLRRRLAPRLREVAAGLLMSRRGLSLDAAPAEGRRILGTDDWQFVGVDAAPPADRLAPGIPVDRLARVVASLEHV
jgi:hypothetical protein